MSTFRRAWQVFRKQGIPTVIQKAVVRVFPFVLAKPPLVEYEDVLAVDWRSQHPSLVNPRSLPKGRLVVAWVMSPPGANSGGHQNIFRFIRFLEAADYEVRIYLYSAIDPTTTKQARRRAEGSSSYPDIRATIERYPAQGVPSDVDAIVATGWETSYRSYRDASDARRFYFVQDFEPLFYQASSEAVLAENTYRFGFMGITAGDWLAHKLHDEYGMTTNSFSFGADASHYGLTNTGRRDAVFFYARPETPRRGFELGAMALDLFSRERPNCPIILAGQNLRKLHISFPHENLGNLQVDQLNEVYNRCAAGLVLSLTNMSLLPLELLAAGVSPVGNDGPNNRLVSDNPYIEFTEPSPRAIADRLIGIVDRLDQASHAAKAAASVDGVDWRESGRQFLEAFERGLRG
ncbi:MAG: glycosyltransferase family 1 protein [Demequinaceae bacterium]|nr:glycosyltransferase family 1 protein [Demequinaceae bacterium]